MAAGGSAGDRPTRIASATPSLLTISECRDILTQANPRRTWTDEDIERLRAALYVIARLALDVAPTPSTHAPDLDQQRAA